MSHFIKEDLTIKAYKHRITLILTDSVKKVKSICPDFEDSEVYAHTLYNGQDTYIVINVKHDAKINNGIIAHEAFHAVNFLAYRCGFPVGYGDDEPRAYLIEHITNKIHKSLRRNNLCKLLE